MIEGEVRQSLGAGAIPARDEYLETIRKKTAAFFAATAEAAAATAGAGGDAVRPYRDFGESFGLAFQITDDLLDWTGSPDVIGKAVGADLAAGKATLPLILAFEAAEDPDALRAAFDAARDGGGAAAAAALADAVSRSGALAASRAEAEAAAARAREALAAIPPSPAREVLSGLLDFVLARDR